MPGSKDLESLWQYDVSLESCQSLRLPGRARRYAEIHSLEQLQGLVASGALAQEAWVILGGGSNVVLLGDLAATVLRIRIPGRAWLGEDGDGCLVQAGAGEDWPSFVAWTLRQGQGGLENLAHIPGTVGAAPVQNIGAYGLEAKDRIHQVEILDLRTGCQRMLKGAECAFGYRDSVFKHAEGRHWVVTRVIFRLPRHWRPETAYADLARQLETAGLHAPTPLEVAEAITTLRRRKLPDPAEIPSAGSFFKNPVLDPQAFAQFQADHPQAPAYPQADGRGKVAAAWLIEQAGWKGRSLGPVGMYERQALVLVNHGGATGADVLRLAQAVQADVRTRFGVELELEPVLLGTPND